ncbi:DegT/DnrJ/EryC1/StrS aminotransferase family protein [Candidatus Saccharibacteria bacterium]|nr:DegT/DnrJ/EryC1/StrS aminotransferase family protein [Candidatus Saccharibacteria bacterium]
MKKRIIPFSPPDISEKEIENVVDVLKSSWITTGPKTKEFEAKIAEYCGTEKAVCLNSNTACQELILKVLGVGPGDEVITSAYTYTASASVIDHVGAKIVLVDTKEGSYEMDYEALEKAITEKTKVIIPVDIAGVMCDYNKIFEIVERKKSLFRPNNDLQKLYGRIIVAADAAHSFGATFEGKRSGSVADFTSFSFHAVKNLTTAEGGALTWKHVDGLDNEALYQEFMLWSLHGQSKDALAKNKLGAWEYDIVYTGQKCNMTDIMAAIGLAQLERYPELLKRRKEIIRLYNELLDKDKIDIIEHENGDSMSSMHLMLTRVKRIDVNKRNDIITKLAEAGIASNVHYKPLPMHTAYKKLGFDIDDYPNAYDMYMNEISLPLHTKLSDEDVRYICEKYNEIVGS